MKDYLNMENRIIHKTFDEERSLYHLVDTAVEDCIFAGPQDGESVLKECDRIEVRNCSFSLRYPLWHVRNFLIENSAFDEKARAALWYDDNGTLRGCNVNSIKILRECRNVKVEDSDITSLEFGWKCDGIKIENSRITSEYIFLDSKNVEIDGLTMHGKYSFQYMENLTIKNSNLDTKDAFWHAKNVTVTDSIVKGEYLGWFSEDLTLIRCKIIGTQPLCYCKNLKLIDCTMEGCDLSFEYSDVDAKVIGHVDSIKNPRSGKIEVDSTGDIIREAAVFDCNAEVYVGGEKK
jgi:hypothetical protein